MAETPPNPQPAPTPAPEPPEPKPAPEPPKPAATEPPPQNLIGEAQRKAKAAEKERDQLKHRLETLEAEKLSDLEKAQKRAEQAEVKAQELEQKAVRQERSAFVTAAASKAGFADPADAVAFLSAELPEDADAAQAAVKQLAESKPHLIKQGPQGPQPFGKPMQPGSTTDMPLDADGKPDVQRGIGQDLLRALTGGR